MLTRRTFIASSLAPLATAAVPSIAGAQLVNKYAEQLQNGEFNWFPERSAAGPVIVIVSIPDQKVHVYRNGIRIAASSCSTGKPGHRTPTGVFKILQKDKFHRSSTYSNAPMPNMNRLTWSGIALHAGNLPGYPASHGCVRLPMAFSERLFQVTRLGMTVVIADENSSPASVVHPGLVLGDYAKREYAAVDLSIKAKQYAEGRVGTPPETSIVVSSADRKVSLWNGSDLVTEGEVRIANPRRPLPNRVYTLTKTDDAKDSLEWSATGYGRGAQARRAAADLTRIKAEPRLRDALRQSLHHGATLVTTGERDSPSKRTGPGFVVIDGLY
ncbi:L,D-transpeptidase [Aestuariivirga sp.]|uniref:L,D-transpeptidase n=1 Tax=Aestuariivirga sp. TaxID=2650926 RepID=UPI0039E5358A